MKFCEKCGKELFDEAVICTGCGCPVESKKVKSKKDKVAINKNYKQWIIILSILFIVFATVAILLLTSNDFIRNSDAYTYLHSDMGQIGKNISVMGAIEWQQEVDAVNKVLVPYYIGIIISGVLGLAALIGDILIIITQKNK